MHTLCISDISPLQKSRKKLFKKHIGAGYPAVLLFFWIPKVLFFEIWCSFIKPMIASYLIEKLRSAETESRNTLNLTHMVNDFTSRRTPPCVLYNTCFDNFHKIYHKTSALQLTYLIGENFRRGKI